MLTIEINIAARIHDWFSLTDHDPSFEALPGQMSDGVLL
jgi:hypothetical protein